MKYIFITLFVINSYFGSITSEIESSFVCPEPNGRFQHHICSKYWQCANYIPQEVDCEERLLWNDFLKVCDWSENVICPTPTTTPPTTTSTTTFPTTTFITTTLLPIITTKETTTSESTTAGSQSTQTTTTTIRTTTLQQENQCPGANHFHRIDDCTKFLWKYEKILV